MFNQIYLKSSKWPGWIARPTIIHEAAHILHKQVDNPLTQIWCKNFHIEKKEDWSLTKIKEENGLVTEYSVYNNNTQDSKSKKKDFQEVKEILNNNNVNYHQKEGIKIELHDISKEKTKTTISEVLHQVNCLPAGLKKIVRHIAIYPKLYSEGFVYAPFKNEEFHQVAEDIAESTREFNVAAKGFNLNCLVNVCNLLHNGKDETSKPRRKLELLAKYGFISQKDAKKLLNKDHLSKLILQARNLSTQPYRTRINYTF